MTQFLPRPTPGSFSNFTSNTDTQTSSPCKQASLKIFRFYSNTDSKSPHSIFPDVDTVVHTHPKVSFRLKTHCNLMVCLDPDPTSPKDNRVIYVSMKPEESLPNESHWDPQIIPPHKFFLDFFKGLGVPHPQGWGSFCPA